MSWLDLLPTREQQKIRKRMRSPAAYEKLRQNVKGPEELTEELEKNAALAELKFSLETEPVVQEKLQEQIENDIREHGLETLVQVQDASPEAKAAVEAGKFSVGVESSGQAEHMLVYPEGNVQEKIPLQPKFTEKFTKGFSA